MTIPNIPVRMARHFMFYVCLLAWIGESTRPALDIFNYNFWSDGTHIEKTLPSLSYQVIVS